MASCAIGINQGARHLMAALMLAATRRCREAATKPLPNEESPGFAASAEL